MHLGLSLLLPLAISTALLNGCHQSSPESSSPDVTPKKIVNLGMWPDELAPDTLSSFERATGVKVNISYFDSEETLETRLLTGHSGFDVVMPSAAFLRRQIASGAYRPLDRNKLPGLQNLDPALMKTVQVADPGSAHAFIFMWGSIGIAYNPTTVAIALPGVKVDSWRVLLEPAYAAKLAACGISIRDDPTAIIRLTLMYEGKDPNSYSLDDLKGVERILLKIRPFIKNISSLYNVDAIAQGDACIALSYGGVLYQVRKRARAAQPPAIIDWTVPKEGSLYWFDMLAIPKDAPHVENAHLLLNYFLDPNVVAKVSNFIGMANAIPSTKSLLNESITSDPAIYPPPDQQERLLLQSDDSPEQSRAITHLWQKFKAGQ